MNTENNPIELCVIDQQLGEIVRALYFKNKNK